MAEIHLSAMLYHEGGPDIPARLQATLTPTKPPELCLFFGGDRVTIWPADPHRIRALAEDLLRVAEELEEQAKQRQRWPADGTQPCGKHHGEILCFACEEIRAKELEAKP